MCICKHDIGGRRKNTKDNCLLNSMEHNGSLESENKPSGPEKLMERVGLGLGLER